MPTKRYFTGQHCCSFLLSMLFLGFASAAVAAKNDRQTLAQPTVLLDVTVLEVRLRNTKAVGFATKLVLKHKIQGLLNAVADYHRERNNASLRTLHDRYNHLLDSIVILLKDKDTPLANDLSGSRKILWDMLIDPVQFAKL